MSFGKDFDFEESMLEAVEGGAALAWRLLATLEGGSLILAASALLAYTARTKLVGNTRIRRPITTVLVTNTTDLLGRELKRQLEACGCAVSTVTAGAASGPISGAGTYDALVVVGAEPKADGLDSIASHVTEDVYGNLKLLESLSSSVHEDGCIAWACVGARSGGVFDGATDAFDAVLQASLRHVAKITNCEPIWVGRSEEAEQTAERVVAALMNGTTTQKSRYSIRNAAQTMSQYFGRWLKIVT